MKKIFIALTLLFPLVLSGCSCDAPIKIKSIQAGDKALTCKDIILEINEAEFFRKEAAIAQRITMQEAFTPTCWLSTYMSGSEAARSANERIEYLSQLYDIMNCGENSSQNSNASSGAPMAAPANFNQAMPPQTAPAARAVPQQNQFGFQPPAAPAPVSQNLPNPNMHIHVGDDGKRYMHAHPHEGAHTHGTSGQ